VFVIGTLFFRMSTLEIIDKEEQSIMEDTETKSWKTDFENIQKVMNRPNVFFTGAILELLFLFIVFFVIVYIAF
jgi:hypothetical protein